MKLPFLNMIPTKFAKVLEYHGKQVLVVKGVNEFLGQRTIEFTGITSEGRVTHITYYLSKVKQDAAFDELTPAWYATQIKASEAKL